MGDAGAMYSVIAKREKKLRLKNVSTKIFPENFNDSILIFDFFEIKIKKININRSCRHLITQDTYLNKSWLTTDPNH